MNLADGPNSSRQLGIMAKYWEPGRVKTRLGHSIGMLAAAAIHREFFDFLTDSLSSLSLGKLSPSDAETGNASAENACLVPVEAHSVDLEIVFDPPNRFSDFQQTLATKGTSQTCRQVWSLERQADGDLGERMRNWFQHALADDASRRAILIGCDCPTLSAEAISAGFDLLDKHDVVIGPALDGGYYLIGLAGPFRFAHDALFRDILWSTGSVLESTVAAAQTSSLSLAMLELRRDVDEADDLQALLIELAESSSPREQELSKRVTEAMQITDAIGFEGDDTDDR